MAWSDKEAAGYIHSLKTQQLSSDKKITGFNGIGHQGSKWKAEDWEKWKSSDNNEKTDTLVKEAVASIPGITRKDAPSIMDHCGSIKDLILMQNFNDLTDIEGVGPKKVKNLIQVARAHFK